MALGIVVKDRNTFGASNAVVVECTGDTSYPTGGYPLTAALTGLDRVGASSITFPVSGGPTGAAVGYRPVYDYANQKIMLFRTDQIDDPMEEVPNATSVSTAVWRALLLSDNPDA